MEKEPVKHLAYDIYNLLKISRNALSKYINCDKDDIVFFPNPSTALNTVIKSLNLKRGDEILSTNHEYGALNKTWNYMCKKTGATYINQKINLPLKSKEEFINTLISGITKKTKIIFLSHITSSTGLIFPVEEICKIAKNKKIFCIIDGAHVPGHIPLDISLLDPDIYVGACHKWMCAPKGTSFLYAKKSIQDEIDPIVISWGYESDMPSHSKFLDYHQWQGTNDLSAYLTIPDVIKFLKKYSWPKQHLICREKNLEARKNINTLLNQSPISDDKFIGQMSTIQIPHIDNPMELKKVLYENYQIQIPILKWNEKTFLRISIQAYNSMEDIEKLLYALKKIFKS